MNQTASNSPLWQAKLHARLHDPAEKALVLLRDPSGHEGGTVHDLHRRLFPEGVADAARTAVKRADWWASAADRPQFPRQASDHRFAGWTQVRFDQAPVLIHPLSGQTLDLRERGGLRDTNVNEIKRQSHVHFNRIIDAVGDDDARLLGMALWRFGPELPADIDAARLGELWRFLPADTRVPDHSIWDHLDLTAAFAGAFAGDSEGECALLSVSLGPVQDFIAQARTASDLWAGSHLLATMAWEAMKVLASELGPESILFPRLRGVAQVDVWLQQEVGLSEELFADQPWRQSGGTDANPLFSASLPNRFLAVVPAGRATDLAQQITKTVRDWARNRTHDAFAKLLDEVDVPDRRDCHGFRQIDAQLAGFPEVHWSVAPYSSVIGLADRQRQIVGDTAALARCLAPFFDAAAGEQPGFLGSSAWRLLRKAVDVADARFYEPNPGVLYPAIHELADRAQAAAKTQRPFSALEQHGYRCSLTGTAEWLTDDPSQLFWSPEKRDREGTLWTRLAEKRPAWARKGEHLGALATLKRLWPTLFVEAIENALDKRLSRFVVSTHAMALATTLKELGTSPLNLDDNERAEIAQYERTALPRRLMTKYLSRHPDGDLIARIPDWLDRLRESDERHADRAERAIRRVLGNQPEAYYGMLLMDGDHMGRWLSGDPEMAITYSEAFHPAVRHALDNRFRDHGALQGYLHAKRALSPNRHLAIAGALGDFSSVIARTIVEDDHMGRLLYAGGDDLMAMVTASDLLPVMAALRGAYSGHPLDTSDEEPKRFAKGFYRQRERLYMTMGERASASMGAIIAHHQAPLGQVQCALKAVEQRAKNAGRNAFCIQIVKRSGGAVTLTLPWQPVDRDADQPSHIACLRELSAKLAEDTGASRRAAYNTYGWLTDLPEPAAVGGESAYREMIESLLHQQFERQNLEVCGQPIHSKRLARLCSAKNAGDDAALVENFLSVAEFLARECRSLA